MRRARASAFLLASLWPAKAPSAAEVLPCAVSVQVLHGPSRAPQRLVDDILEALVRELEEHGCHAAVRAGTDAASGADLVFQVTLEEVRDEARHDVSLADRAAAQLKGTTSDFLGVHSVTARFDLLTLPELTPIRSSRATVEESRRPLSALEDARALARESVLLNLVLRARKFVCWGSVPKMRKRIDSVRSSRGLGAPPPPR